MNSPEGFKEEWAIVLIYQEVGLICYAVTWRDLSISEKETRRLQSPITSVRDFSVPFINPLLLQTTENYQIFYYRLAE